MPAPSVSAIACMSATSSSTRATAAGHTRIISSRARAGSFAIVSAMRQCACVSKPSSFARSARSRTMRAMVALVSFASPLSPRPLKRFHTCSRRSRRSDEVRNGSTLDRVLTTTHLPRASAPRRRRSRPPRRLGQAREVGLALEHRPRVLVGEHLGAELGEQAGELLVDAPELRLLRGAEPCARVTNVSYTSSTSRRWSSCSPARARAL
jgi:hypothetical protein